MADLTVRQNDTWPPLRGLATESALTITGSAIAGDTITLPGHGYAANDMVVLSGLAGGAPLVNGNLYFVKTPTLNTFQLALTSGGAAIDITTDITAGTVKRILDLSTAAGGVVVKLIGTVTITGTVTVINPPIEEGGQLFNWKYLWAAADTGTLGDYIARLLITWDAASVPPKKETVPNANVTGPTVSIVP
jgi:hypothetical protein